MIWLWIVLALLVGLVLGIMIGGLVTRMQMEKYLTLNPDVFELMRTKEANREKFLREGHY